MSLKTWIEEIFMSTIKENDQVTIHYTGTLNTGEPFDSSIGKEPLTFEVGGGQVIPGFEKAVLGMKPEERKTFKIAPEDAYGDVSEELVYDIPRETVPAELKPEKGMRLVSSLEDGREIPVTILEVDEKNIKLDANHPLAGEELTFDIQIVGIN